MNITDLRESFVSGVVSASDIAMLEAQGIVTRDEARLILGAVNPSARKDWSKEMEAALTHAVTIAERREIIDKFLAAASEGLPPGWSRHPAND